jgi:hypothetical protein
MTDVMILEVAPYEWISGTPPRQPTFTIVISAFQAADIRAIEHEHGKADMLLFLRDNYTAADAKRLILPPPDAPFVLAQGPYSPAIKDLLFEQGNHHRRAELDGMLRSAQNQASVESMTALSDFVAIAHHLPSNGKDRGTAQGLRMDKLHVDSVVVGRSAVSEIWIYGDPPRSAVEGRAIYFLKRIDPQTYELVGVGKSALLVQKDIVVPLQEPIHAVLQRIKAARAAMTKTAKP